MYSKRFDFRPGSQLSARAVLIWRIVQAAVWLVGAAILYCLLFYPALGILLFWNILIPVAPALFVVAAGVWRNVCPLATTNLLPRHLGLSKRRKLSVKRLGIFNLIAVIALYVIVPLRHALFNTNGPATGLLIISMTVIGVTMGFFYEWKSAWCSGLCPIHPVEKLYGGNVLRPVPNAHCDQCMKCVALCPDSTPNVNPKFSVKTDYQKTTALLIVGGLPGFIWGWFHVPDETQLTSLSAFFGVYEMPLLGLTVTLVIYAVLSSIIRPEYERKLVSFFAASGVSCYYWYRIPALFGYGSFGKDGLLINLRNVAPGWSITALTIATTVFFFYWLYYRKQSRKSWLIRPQFGHKHKTIVRKLSA
ncbi:MAG TPA: hypothetical protein VIJ27_01275 [Mucilaginibacter sp.]